MTPRLDDRIGKGCPVWPGVAWPSGDDEGAGDADQEALMPIHAWIGSAVGTGK